MEWWRGPARRWTYTYIIVNFPSNLWFLITGSSLKAQAIFLLLRSGYGRLESSMLQTAAKVSSALGKDRLRIPNRLVVYLHSESTRS